MSDVLFYHLEGARLEGVLPSLLEKSRARGWRAVVRCGAQETADRLDESLWTYSEESFLPHGAGVDEAAAADEPVWLTAGPALPNAPHILFAVDGAAVALGELDGLERCVLIFDGGDEAAVRAARDFWRTVRDSAHEATYWRQSAAGRWEKQA